MNNSQRLELQPQLIEGDGDFVKGKIFIGQVVDVQSPTGGNPTQQKTKKITPTSGETEDGVKVLTTTQYKVFICSLHSSSIENENLPWATPYWVNSNLGSTTIPSPRFAPGTFVHCFQEQKSRRWYIEAAVPNQLEKVTGTPEERCKAFSGFTQQNTPVPETATQGDGSDNVNSTTSQSQQPGRIADGAETQNVVPTTADDKQNAPRESGEELIIPKACKEAARQSSFGINNSITKLIKDIEKFSADNPLIKAQDLLGEASAIVNKAAGDVTAFLANLIQEMKAFLLRQVSQAVQTVSGAVSPPSGRYFTNDVTDGVLANVSCLFDKILKALLSQVINFLNGILNKLVNAATCVVEGLVNNFLGQILGQINGIIQGLIGQISGAIGQVLSLAGQVKEFIVTILQLLICEPEPKCADNENYNFLEGPDTTETFNISGLFDQAKGIIDSFSNFNVNLNVDDFEFQLDAENAIKNTLTDCYAGPISCGPPRLSLYGGVGSGGLFNPVLTEAGELFGFQVIDPGQWSVAPKGKVVDDCGNGTGAIVDDIIIGDIPDEDPEGDADPSVARITITKQPENVNVLSNTQVTFKVRAKIEPTDGKKMYRWYYSSDLGENFQYIPNNNKSNLKVNATKSKDNWYYICQVFDARDVRKSRKAKSVKSDVVRLNLTDVKSPGDDVNIDDKKPKITLKISKKQITKDYAEKAKVSWTVTGTKIKDVRFIEIRKYKKGKVKDTIYQTPTGKKPARSGSITVCPPVDTIYRVVATNNFGTTQVEKELDVKFVPNKCQFELDHSLSKPEIATSNDEATMFWRVVEKGDPAKKITVTGISSPGKKGSKVVSPSSDTTYHVDVVNQKGKYHSSVTLGVGNTYIFPITNSADSSFFTHESPDVCASLNTWYITKDGDDSAQLSCYANGNNLRINSVQVTNLTTNTSIFDQTYPGPSNPYEFEKTFTVNPKRDSNFALTVATNIGVSTSIIKLQAKGSKNCGKLVVKDPPKDDDPGDPGKPGDPKDPGTPGGRDCPNGFEYSFKEKKCVRKVPKDPWLPPPLFPPGIIRVPIIDPGIGYDPTIPGTEGGGGRTWKDRCEVAIERVNGDWEVIGIGTQYNLYLGDSVYLPEREPITLGVPNGNRIYDGNPIAWEDLTVKEIEEQIPGSKVFGEPWRIKDMSGFDDSRGSEIFKDVSMLDIKPISLKGLRVSEGIYFDMTEFDDFIVPPDVTFIAANRTEDRTYHQVEIPEIGLFTEDAGRVIKKGVPGGIIYGPLKSKSRIPKTRQENVDVEGDVRAPGWNGPGIYYETLDLNGTIDVDFTVVDSNYGADNAIRIPGIGNFKDGLDGGNSRVEEKKVAAPKMYGPLTSTGIGKIYIGGTELGGDSFDDSSVLLGFDNVDSASFVLAGAEFTNDSLPQLVVTKKGLVSFTFRTDDNPNQSGIAIEKIIIRDPDTNAALFEFDYAGDGKNEDTSAWYFFTKTGTYPMEYIANNPDTLNEIRVRKDNKLLQFDDNPANGFDVNAELEIRELPNLQVLEPTTLSFTFFTDDDPDVEGIAIERIIIKDPDTNAAIFTFNYRQEFDEVRSEEVTLYKLGTYPVEYVTSNPVTLDDVRIGKGGRRISFDDNPTNGFDLNAYLQIENARDVSATLMSITGSEGTFKRYKKPPQIKGTKTLKKAKEVIVGFEKGTVETRMYLETETQRGKTYATGLEGIFDEADIPQNDKGDITRYYENSDSSRTLIVSQGLKNNNKLPFDMILRCDTGVFKRYDKAVRLWRYEVEYRKARDLGFTDKDVRWHLEHVFKSGTGDDYSSQNIIDEAMEKRLRDPNFGPLPQNFDNVKDMSSFDPGVVGGGTGYWKVGAPGFGFIRDYPYARSLGYSDADIRYYLTEIFPKLHPEGRIGIRMKAKLLDPTFGVFSYNPTFKINVGRPNFFDCENDYPYALSLGFSDIDIRFYLQYVYLGLVDECMKAKLEDPNWGRIPDFRVEVTSRGCKDPCEGIVCPEGFVCKDGKCIPVDDPCVGVVCPEGFVCVNGECVPEPPSYPIIVTLCGIRIDNPGFGYECDKDQIVVTPDRGVEIEYKCDDLGRLVSVDILKPGIGFTEIPTITIKTTTGRNAVLRPVFCFEEPDDDKDPCDGVRCIPPQVCVDGECVDPCSGDEDCPEGYVCENGRCVPKDPCEGVICPEGYICKDGVCVPNPCYGVVCPEGYICVNGKCVPVKTPIPPGTPVVRVVDCVGKINPGNPGSSPGSPGGGGGGGAPGRGGPGGKAPYRRPKREVCN